MLKREHRGGDSRRSVRLVETSTAAPRFVDDSLGTFTIADLLATDAVAEGDPVVVTGREHLNRAARWLRVIEPGETLSPRQEGEVVLAGAANLAECPDGFVGFVEAMTDNVSALVIQLDDDLSSVPLEMVRVCKAGRFPLIALRRPVRRTKVTEAAHVLIVDRQQRILQATLAAHERFTELSAAGASVEDIVAAVGELAGGEVVFSNLMHKVLAVHAINGGAEDVLRRWGECACALTRSVGPKVDEAGQWIAVPVEAHGRERGWLVHFPRERPDPPHEIVLERAAGALAMRLLLDDDETTVANAERSVLADLLAGRIGSTESMHARTAALGHPTRDRRYLPVVVIAEESSDLRSLLSKAVDQAGLDALVGRVAPERWDVLLLLDSADDTALDAFARYVARDSLDAVGADPTLGCGAVVSRLSHLARSFAEAADVASAARAVGAPKERHGLFSIEDVKLRGLLYTLRNEPRLQAFVERSLGPLQLRDAVDGGQWVRTLAVYLRVNGNKSLAAQELGISRPTLYERLARIQRLLQADLEDFETTTSLFAAIMVVEATSDAAGVSNAIGEVRRHTGRGA